MLFSARAQCGLVAALVGWALSVGSAAAENKAAENKTVHLLSWGGSIQTMFEKEGYAQKFKEATGYTLVLVPKPTVAEIMASAIAQKDNPQVDVVFAEVNAFMNGIDQGIFETLSEKDLQNLSKMYDFARIGDKGIAVVGDVPVVVYREDMFKKAGWAPPTSFADLQRPELKGKVIVPPVSSTFGLYYLLELARLHGGSEKNIEPGFAALKEMAPRVLDWTSTFAKIGELLESQEAAIAVWGTTGVWEVIDRGVPAKVVPPDPVYLSMSAVGIMKNAPNPEGALALANWFMGEQHLAYRAVRFGETPLNREVKPVGGKADRRVKESDMAKVVKLDYDHIRRHRTEWIERWQREIARKQ